MTHYTQLTLWTDDGEIFAGPAPEGADSVEVTISEQLKADWESIARIAAQRQQEMASYFDAAFSREAM